MAWFRRNKNEDDYSNVHHPVILDSNARKHPVVGYKETIDSAEARRRYGNPMQWSGTGLGYDEQKYTGTIDSNEAARLYSGVFLPNENKIMQMHPKLEKTSEFSPKARDEVVHRQNKNSPWNNGYRDNSPPSNDQYRTRHQDYGKHNNFNSKTNNKYHDDDDEDEEEDDVICNDEVCFENPRKGSKPNYFKDENYNNENEKHKGNGYSPPTYTVPISTQPKRDANYKTPDINTPIY